VAAKLAVSLKSNTYVAISPEFLEEKRREFVVEPVIVVERIEEAAYV